MANEVQALVDRIVAAAGVTAQDALARYNTAHKKMVARSGCYRKSVAVGDTVAGQVDYAAPDGLLELRELEVGGVTYSRMRHQDAAAAARGALRVSGGGVFAEQRDGDGAAELTIFPVPSDVQPIVAYGTFLAADQSGSATPLVDPDFWDDLVDYAIALSVEREDFRLDVGNVHRQRFDTACEELRRRVRDRFRGGGPRQIRVIGVNA